MAKRKKSITQTTCNGKLLKKSRKYFRVYYRVTNEKLPKLNCYKFWMNTGEKNGTRKNGPQKNGPREKWSPENCFPENWSLEKWFPENWSPEQCPSKIVLSEKIARKYKRLLRFYRLIPLHTQKDVWRLPHDPTYAPNCRTLKESRKVCCQVLRFHRLITSEPSTHTHTHTHHDARRSTHNFLFLSFPRTNFPETIFQVIIFPGTNFPAINFPGFIFPGNHFSGDHFSGIRKKYP